MIRNVLICLVGLIVLAVLIWVVDLVVQAVLNRLNIPPDIKQAARAVVAVILFIIALVFILNMVGAMPAGWWEGGWPCGASASSPSTGALCKSTARVRTSAAAPSAPTAFCP